MPVSSLWRLALGAALAGGPASAGEPCDKPDVEILPNDLVGGAVRDDLARAQTILVGRTGVFARLDVELLVTELTKELTVEVWPATGDLPDASSPSLFSRTVAAGDLAPGIAWNSFTLEEAEQFAVEVGDSLAIVLRATGLLGWQFSDTDVYSEGRALRQADGPWQPEPGRDQGVRTYVCETSTIIDPETWAKVKKAYRSQ